MPDDIDDRAALAARLVDLHGTEAAPTAQQWRTFLDVDDGPVLMVYLVQFRDRAVYPPGVAAPDRSGAEAFFHAGEVIAEVIAEVGGQPLLGGFPTQSMVAADELAWDYLGAARYPSRDAFVRLWLDPRTVAAGVHRRAGTRRHRLYVTRPLF